MEAEIKPLKRDINLVPLSKEHHFGLLFCWKIKQGLAKGTPLPVIRDYVLFFWTHNLREHLEQEEKALLDILPDNDVMQLQLLKEHTLIRDLIKQVQQKEELSALLFEALHLLVSEHIRFEERQFFPHIQQVAQPEQLERIGRLLLEEHHPVTDEFEPAFWLKDAC